MTYLISVLIKYLNISKLSFTLKVDQSSSSISSIPLSSTATGSKIDLSKRPIRQRIMQLLILRPLTKGEIVLRLLKDGLEETDKTKIGKILCYGNFFHFFKQKKAQIEF